LIGEAAAMIDLVRCVMVLSMLGLGGSLAAAAETVPSNAPPAKDGSCLHHTLADKDVTVKLANGEKYDDRYPKKEGAGVNTQHVMMPLHTFLCKDGRITMLQ
jgi:hypothetical protein